LPSCGVSKSLSVSLSCLASFLGGINPVPGWQIWFFAARRKNSGYSNDPGSVPADFMLFSQFSSKFYLYKKITNVQDQVEPMASESKHQEPQTLKSFKIDPPVNSLRIELSGTHSISTGRNHSKKASRRLVSIYSGVP